MAVLSVLLVSFTATRMISNKLDFNHTFVYSGTGRIYNGKGRTRSVHF